VGNNEYKKNYQQSGGDVKTGETMSSVFSQNPKLIPPMVINMISIGEKTAA